jgi:hypothetical protein|tara:strand:- start:2039 stop:2242 length:204 start_codon:yes stop_codon:yes gene_type:complete
MDHFIFIESIGDTGAVAKTLGFKLSRVSNWKRNGIPWKYRLRIADIANERGVELPKNFLRPETGEAA